MSNRGVGWGGVFHVHKQHQNIPTEILSLHTHTHTHARTYARNRANSNTHTQARTHTRARADKENTHASALASTKIRDKIKQQYKSIWLTISDQARIALLILLALSSKALGI